MPARSQWFSRCMGLTNSVQPYCMFESMTVHPTIRASWTHRLIEVSTGDGVMGFRPCLLGQIGYRRVHAACAMRDAEGRGSHPPPGERAGEHQPVHTAEMADPEHTARKLAEPRPERHIETAKDQRAESSLIE